ncbi:unnamed protein product [Peniophora sp. CBMAI 1063]|nr:unnamed protein product [Peniophora sp. CBMAI 1063]
MSSNEVIDSGSHWKEKPRLAWAGFIASRFQTEHRLDELDYELELLQEFSVQARAQRNALTAISKLPTEIICHIFGLLCQNWAPRSRWEGASNDGDSEVAGYPNRRGIGYDLGWMKVSHVCASWRRIALSTPSLWCDIHCASLAPGIRKAVIGRSSDRPLNMKLDYSRGPTHLSAAEWSAMWLDIQTSTIPVPG